MENTGYTAEFFASEDMVRVNLYDPNGSCRSVGFGFTLTEALHSMILDIEGVKL